MCQENDKPVNSDEGIALTLIILTRPTACGL